MQDLENNAEVWCVMLELVQEIGTKLRTHKRKQAELRFPSATMSFSRRSGSAGLAFRHKAYLSGETAFSLFAKNYQWEHPISFGDGSGNQSV